MKGLLAIEWLKLRRYRTFWVLAGLFLVLVPLWNFEVANGLIKLGGDSKEGVNFLSTAYSFPQVWGNMGFWGSIFIMFISVLVIIVTTNEYTYRTHRQNVIDGWSRMQFFHGKVLLVLVLSLIATIFLFVLGMLFGLVNSGSLSSLFSDFEQVGYFFVLAVNYLGLALLIAIWIKRSGLAIGLFFLYSMIIENILRGVINHYSNLPYGNLLPLQASDELLPFPLMEMARRMVTGGASISPVTYLIVSVAWCGIYYFACRTILQKRDW